MNHAWASQAFPRVRTALFQARARGRSGSRVAFFSVTYQARDHLRWSGSVAHAGAASPVNRHHL